MASAIVPLLEKIAENTTPSIAYNQKNYKPSQDTVLGTMSHNYRLRILRVA